MRNIWTYPLVIILLSGWVGAAIIQVPSEVTTIQKAIDLASAGDTIVVAEGVYSEYLQMQGKDITLTSVMPNDPGAVGRTILQPPAGFTGPVVRFSGAETPACLLDGLTIQKGQDGGIKGSNTHATISRCWIRNNNGNNCGGITAVIGLIDRCRIMGNSGVETGGLLGCGDISNCLIADNSGNVGGVNAGGGTLSNCLIVSNQGKIGASGVGFYSGPILHCTIANNFSSGFAVPGVNVSSPSTISNCIIWGNRTVNAMSVPIIKDVIPPSDPTFSCFSNAPEENGNISADPQLGPGYSLMAGSPCIDAGTNTPPIPLAASDYRGANRVVDGDDAASVVTDMGAIEFDPTGLMVVIQPDRLDFGGTTDGGWSRTQTFEVYNLDGYSGPLQLDTGGASWLTAEPTNGTITQSAQTIAVTVDPTGLAEGEHRGGVMVKVDEDTRMVVDIVLHVGKVIRVPQNSTLIQGAIQMAKDWDTIIMSPGTYKENLDFLGKKIYVRSADPQDWNTVKTTIVDGRCSLPCITFNKGEGRDSIVEGLTLQLGGGNFASYGSVNNIMGGGILCLNSSPTIRRCNVSWNGYGATGGSFPPYTGNWKVYYGGGIALVGACSARIEDCLLIGNLAYSRGSAIYAIGDSSARNEIERCTITDNYFYQSPMGSSFDVDLTGTGASIRNSIVWSTVNQASILISDTDRIQNCLLRYAAVYSGSYSTLIWADVICRNGNLSAGPRFVYPYSSSAPTAYDYRLMADSPCINHGHAGFAGEGQTDLAGNKRVMGGRLDIGAFEFAPEIRVTHPMEGDVWAAGSHHEVIWTEPHIGPVISNSEFGMWYINSIVEGSSTTNDMEVRGWTIGPDSGVDFVPNQIDSIPKYAKTFTAFDRGSGVYQELVDSFGPNTRYTLKLFVGSRKDKAPVTSWQAALTAGDRDTVVAAVTQNQFGNPGLGKWIEVVVTLETGAEGVDPNVGKRIGILLTGAPRVSFVGVSLEAAELAPTATVDVELSTDDGQTWQTIADDVADAGSYSWSIPSDLASEICRILVASERWPDFIWVPGNVFSIRPYEAGAPVESRWPTEGHDMQRMGLAGDNGPELGCVKWQYSTLTPISGNSVLGADERIVVASEGGDLDCLNTDGQLIWKYSTRSPEEHLEGCWMMNDGSGVTAADCLGVRNGSLNNFDASGTSWVEDATFGTVLEFDGVDDYVRIPGFKGISGSQPRVCSAWIQTTQANTDIMMWGSNGASGTRWRIRLQERDGVGVLKAEINGGNILGCTPVNTGKWVHVRVVLPVGKTNSQDILLFVNGIREPSESVSILPFEIQTASDLDVHIGASLYAGSYFQGRMRDVRISTISEGNGLGLGNLSIGPDGTVYVGDGSGVLHAVDSAGQLRWKHQTSGMIGGAPAVTGDGKVIFGSVDGTVVALAADGSELWTFAVPGPGTVGGAALASPTIGRDGNIYVGGLYDGKLYALASEDGQVVWTCDFGGGTANPHLSIANAPAVATDGTIYATLINDAKLYAIDPDDGSIVWTANLTGTAGGSFGADYPTRYKEVYPWASPAIGPDGTIYVAFDDPYLRAVNPDGSIRWVTRLGMVGGFVVSVGAGGKIYAAGDDHSLYVLDPEGTILSQFDGSNWLSWPVIGADETLYISDFAGTLWAIAPQPCENKSQRLARPADITLDGKIRLEDLAELAKAWKECTDLLTGSPCLTTGSGWKRIANAIYLSGDIDRDYYVRLSDLLAMADKWMGN